MPTSWVPRHLKVDILTDFDYVWMKNLESQRRVHTSHVGGLGATSHLRFGDIPQDEGWRDGAGRKGHCGHDVNVQCASMCNMFWRGLRCCGPRLTWAARMSSCWSLRRLSLFGVFCCEKVLGSSGCSWWGGIRSCIEFYPTRHTHAPAMRQDQVMQGVNSNINTSYIS